MLSREERILSELILSRGLVPREALERCASARASVEASLVEVLVGKGHLETELGARIAEEARSLDRALAPETPGGGQLGEFRLLREIGRGGMGVVWEAHQESLDRTVALKLLPTGTIVDERAAIRFLREARAAARLQHPGIVQVHTSGNAGGVLYFAMELVAGRSLDDLIATGPLEPVRAARIAAQVAEAVAHAHREGVIHRDLKPGNILLDAEGRAKVTDFGLALDALTATATVTLSHHVLGTPAYMAPEQARGEKVDERGDVYGLGALLYAMLTGRPPYRGQVPAVVLGQVLSGAPPSLDSLRPDTPPDLASICRRAMAREREGRLESAAAMGRELAAFLGTSSAEIPAAPEGPPVETAPRPRRRRAGTRALGLALATVAVVVAVLLLPDAGRRREASREETPPARPSGVAPPLGSGWRRLATPPGQKAFPSLSPDGRRIAYSVHGGGRWQVQVDAIDGAATVALGDLSRLDQLAPRFSPDGEWLVLSAMQAPPGPAELLLVPAGGGEARPLGRVKAGDTTWSPDGRRIAYLDALLPAFPERAHAGLWMLDVGTAGTRLLTSMDARQPRWSPGGHRIAFVSRTGGRLDVWSIAPDGSRLSRVTGDAANDWSPLWSADGSRLYFGSDRGGSAGLWRVAVDETTGQVLGDAEPVGSGPLPWRFYLARSSDASRMALVAGERSEVLVRVPFDPEPGVVLGPPVPIPHADAPRATSPGVSPAGDRLAFAAATLVQNIAVWQEDGDVRFLMRTADRDGSPRWSPDGQRIAFQSDRSGSLEIWTMDPDGGRARRHTDTPGRDAAGPVWSPDGTRLAATLLAEGAFLVRADRGWEEQEREPLPALAGAPAPFRPASWSPDGKVIAGAAGGVVLYHVDEGRYERLTDSGDSPVWLGRRLLFARGDRIELLDPATGASRVVFSAEPLGLSPSLAVSRDGGWIYLSLVFGDDAIWILENTAGAGTDASAG